MSRSRVAVHQPNLFPWLGFFDKAAAADVFVLLDIVPFTRGGYQNRVRIKSRAGAAWLTVPVLKKGRLAELTNTVRINNSKAWRHDHLEALRHNYAKAAGYPAHAEALAELYSTPAERLVDLTVPTIRLLMGWLGLTAELVLASDLMAPGLHSSPLLAELVMAAGGSTYVSGPTGRDYLDEGVFSSQGIAVEYRRFVPFAYPQRFGEFVPGLSALDLVLNVPDAAVFAAGRVGDNKGSATP